MYEGSQERDTTGSVYSCLYNTLEALSGFGLVLQPVVFKIVSKLMEL